MSLLSAINIFGNKKTSVMVRQLHGLHCRPSGAIAKLSSQTDKPIYFSYNKKDWVNVKGSLLTILLMNIAENTKLKIKTPRAYPKDILNNILEVLQSKDVSICSKFLREI